MSPLLRVRGLGHVLGFLETDQEAAAGWQGSFLARAPDRTRAHDLPPESSVAVRFWAAIPFKGVARDRVNVEISLHCEGMDNLAAALPDFTQSPKGPSGRNAEFLPKFALRRRPDFRHVRFHL
jgi:hypothetical protein